MSKLLRPTKETGDQYWYAKNADGTVITGKTEPGLVTRSGAVEFEYGTAEDVAVKLVKYKDKLPIENKDASLENDRSDIFVVDATGKLKISDKEQAIITAKSITKTDIKEI